ncbi:hypothetical protein [Clostridium sp.]|uniref:hypothetical protein n=1 Tax=Clostridium sp. TaxID=1506 RepID=UPI002FCA04D0
MDLINSVKEILENKKWIKNDIGMSRVQLAKLMNLNDSLVVLIKTDSKKEPLWAMVEKIIKINDDVMVFFDGRYDTFISKDEYDDYKNYISQDEWNLLFKEDGIKKIIEKNLIDEKGFYLDIHDNLRNFDGEYKEDEWEKVRGEILK